MSVIHVSTHPRAHGYTGVSVHTAYLPSKAQVQIIRTVLSDENFTGNFLDNADLLTTSMGTNPCKLLCERV